MENSNEYAELACTLTDAEFRDRQALARQTILHQIFEYTRLANGLNIQFTNSENTLSDIKEFIILEQGCCGFLNFDLPQNRPAPDKLIQLTITGPAEATRFIDIFINLIEEEANATSAA